MEIINLPKVLHKGIHVVVLPLNKPLPIEQVFPRELCGSYIEELDDFGHFVNKQLVLYENGRFVVDDSYRELRPMQVLRLQVTRDMVLHWYANIHFRNANQIQRESLPYAEGYSVEKAHYLMQLCKLVYEDEKTIKRVLKQHHEIDEVFYFSKQTAHRRLINKSYFKLLYLFFKARTTVVDLQFMKLIKYDESVDRHTLILVFKGSKEAEDWVTNLSFKGVNFVGEADEVVHRGFQDALKLFLRTISQHCFELNGRSYQLTEKSLPSLNKKTKIILTGHSLGGAIATLAATYFLDKGIDPENLEVYTFGAPPLASKGFVEHYKDKFPIYRVVNSADIVPKLNLINRKLFHLGDEIVLHSNNGELHTPSGYIDNLLDAL